MLKSGIEVPRCIIEELNYYNYTWIQKQMRWILEIHGYSDEYIEDFIKKSNDFIPLYLGYETDIIESIDIIKKSGGIPILAHPNRIKLDRNTQKELIRYLNRKGLMGLETYHSSSTKDSIAFYRDLSQRLHLLESVGSDFHYHTLEENVNIGSGIDNNLLQTDCSLKRYILERKRL